MKLLARLAWVLACAVPLHVVDAATRVGVEVPKHSRSVLANGMTLIVVPQPEVPLLAFNLVIKGGGRLDVPQRAGVASLTAGLLEKGAGARDAFAFADAVAAVGGSFNAGAADEAIAVSGQFLSRDRELLLELLADVAQRARLDEGEFSKLRDRDIEFIRAAKDSDPSGLIGTYGRAMLYGNHPYGLPTDGSEASLARIRVDDVRAFYRDNVSADRATLVLAGDVDPKWAQRAVRKAFAGWQRAKNPLPALAAAAPLAERRVLLIDSPGSAQTYFWLGNVGVDRYFDARAALDIVNTLYGGRFTSILNSELRIKSGLSYGASSRFSRGRVAGPFAIASFTQTDTTVQAIDLALATLGRLHDDAVDAEMIDSARAYVLGQYPLRLETAGHWAGALAELDLYGLGTEYIEGYGAALNAVTTEDARRVIERAFPTPDHLQLVLIGDASRIREGIAKYGPVTEMPLAATEFHPGP
ncbi:MAG: pitrilysin family protein [Steroidobacteraceae bacterium]